MTEEERTSPADLVHPEAWWKDLPRRAYADLERVPTGHPWFEVYRLEPDLFAIYEDGQFEETLSYLVLGGERAALIDTGDGIGAGASMAVCAGVSAARSGRGADASRAGSCTGAASSTAARTR